VRFVRNWPPWYPLYTEGGINDIGFPTIINPFTTEKKIVKLSEEFCFKQMTGLLRTVKENFPNAHLVVTGYFPFISKDTNPQLVSDLLKKHSSGFRKGRRFCARWRNDKTNR
jgi:hypothetical protein